MPDSQPTVEFREIPDWPGYRAGDDGTVWSSWWCRPIMGRRGFVWVIGQNWRKLKPLVTRKGYLQVTLRKNGRNYQRSIHRLVLEAFVGPRPPGMECRHFPDHSPANNTLRNIRWGTRAENESDKRARRIMSARDV